MLALRKIMASTLSVEQKKNSGNSGYSAWNWLWASGKVINLVGNSRINLIKKEQIC